MKLKPLQAALLSAFATAPIFGSGSVFAQQVPPASPPSATAPEKVERIEVTGSSIRRLDGEAALPVSIIKREEIAKSGATTAAELLAKVSSNPGSAYIEAQSADGFFPGFSGVSLRGVGEGTTLVLLNGRRLANFAFSGNGVDLNSIPIAAVERVEVLKDGASAIYGTDAIGGVINFILRKDYRGGELSAFAGKAQRSGGGQTKAAISAGFGSLSKDRYNVIVSADIAENQALRASQRSFANTGYRPDIGLDTTSSLGTFPANIFLLDSDGNLAGITNPASATGCPAGTVKVFSACNFDEAAVRDLIPKTQKASLFSRANFEINADHRLFAEALYTRNRIRNIDSPPNVTLYYLQTTGAPPLVFEGTTYYPRGFEGQGAVPIAWRAVTAGNRVDTATTQSGRYVFGAEGTVASMDYNAAFGYSESKAVDRFDQGFLSFSKFSVPFEAGLINPFGPSGAAGEAAYRSAQVTGDFRSAKSSVTSLDAKVSRDLVDMPGGALAMAVGVDVRREKFSDVFAPEFATDTIGFGAAPSTTASRNVQAVYGEFSIPITKQLEAQLALRHDRYSGVGGSTNPKFALRFNPTKEMLVRASVGTGFRAPSLRELFTGQVPASTGNSFEDPVRCPVTKLLSDCDSVFLATVYGPTKLEPEKSRQFSVGFAFEPTKSFFGSVDYWSIEKRNDIVTVDPTLLFANFNEFASRVTRGPVDPRFPSVPGPITNVALGYGNFGKVETNGVDIESRYRFGLGGAGRLDLSMRGTLVGKYDRTRGNIKQSSLGRGDNGPPIQRWRHGLTADWTVGAWGAVLSNNFVSKYRDERLDGEDKVRTVKSYSTWDGQLNYAPVKSLKLTLGIRNLLDTKPPVSNQQALPVSGYDGRYADPRGRYGYLSANLSF
jgi:iron complex outermembrane recepter protein